MTHEIDQDLMNQLTDEIVAKRMGHLSDESLSKEIAQCKETQAVLTARYPKNPFKRAIVTMELTWLVAEQNRRSNLK